MSSAPSCPNSSCVRVTKEVALQCVNTMIARAERAKEEVYEHDVQKAMRDKKVSLGWFKHRKMTRAEAEAWVEGYDEEWDCFPNSCYRKAGDYYIQLGQRIIAALALSSDDTVWLSLEDAATLKEYS